MGSDSSGNDGCGGYVRCLCCCWGDLLHGKACCIYNLLFSPIVLFLWAVHIYVSECFSLLCARFFYGVLCAPCAAIDIFWCPCKPWKYTDTKFPPEDTSLGKLSGDHARGDEGKLSKKVVWLRAGGFGYINSSGADASKRLFPNNVNSNAVMQGALGNCWLLAGAACLAERKGGLDKVFLSRQRNPRGKYQLRIYDGYKDRWERITIDDLVPCDARQWDKKREAVPVFSQTANKELWPLLLEKAFAKFVGSYAALEGGDSVWAIRAMTGDPGRWFRKCSPADTSWTRTDLRSRKHETNKRFADLVSTGEELDDDALFDILHKYHSLGSVLCADRATGRGGLKIMHAYSIIDVVKIVDQGTKLRMLLVRNPWGQCGWTGRFCEDSPAWDKFPCAAKQLRHRGNHGAFWIEWSDYATHFLRVGVVHRTVDIYGLNLQLKKTKCCGERCSPCCGCIHGCCHFWCCCQGASLLYCPQKADNMTVKRTRFDRAVSGFRGGKYLEAMKPGKQ